MSEAVEHVTGTTIEQWGDKEWSFYLRLVEVFRGRRGRPRKYSGIVERQWSPSVRRAFRQGQAIRGRGRPRTVPDRDELREIVRAAQNDARRRGVPVPAVWEAILKKLKADHPSKSIIGTLEPKAKRLAKRLYDK